MSDSPGGAEEEVGCIRLRWSQCSGSAREHLCSVKLRVQVRNIFTNLEKYLSINVCRAEPYWTYELCHGKYLRQYHEEREGKNVKLQEYYLGKFTKVMFENLADEHEKDKANGITRHPPTKSIEKIEMPYHEILMTEGTLCDLTGLPRKTRVLYTCYPSGRNEIYSFKEVSTCEYEVVVLTSTLCQHPR